jgi:hypothetical protein
MSTTRTHTARVDELQPGMTVLRPHFKTAEVVATVERSARNRIVVTFESGEWFRHADHYAVEVVDL